MENPSRGGNILCVVEMLEPGGNVEGNKRADRGRSVGHYAKFSSRPQCLSRRAAVAGAYSRFDVGLDLQANRLVMVEVDCSSLNVRFDFQAISNRLVVVEVDCSSLNVRFDFHICP